MVDNKVGYLWTFSFDVFVLVYFIGLLCSKAILGIGMAGLTITALGYYLTVRPTDTKDIRVFLFPILIFLITIISGLISEDKDTWMTFLSKKAPFLFLPLAFYAIRDHVRLRFFHYLQWFVGLITLVSSGILANYLMNVETANKAIVKGQSIFTPIDHTEFSIFVSFAILISIFLFREQRRLPKFGTRSTKLLLALFLFVFLHILAVRSGLAVLYISALFLGGWQIISARKYTLFIPLLIGLIVIPLLSIQLVPSLKKKIDYVKYDLHRYRTGQGVDYSDSERIYSLQAGWKIFTANKVIGDGIGDLKKSCNNYYQKNLDKSLGHYPHNQYLFTLAAMGLIGFIVYFISIAGPVILLGRRMDYYYSALIAVVLISGMVENTLERTFSIGFYLFFALASISYLTTEWAPRKSSSL